MLGMTGYAAAARRAAPRCLLVPRAPRQNEYRNGTMVRGRRERKDQCVWEDRHDRPRCAGVPDLADGVAGFQRLTGVRPVMGGSHINLGTANYLVGLGGGAYLEIIGPDPDQPDPAQPRPFGMDSLNRLPGGRLVRSAARPRPRYRGGHNPRLRPRGSARDVATHLRRNAADVAADFTRHRPIGQARAHSHQLGTTPHPTTAALPTLPLHSLQAEHPDPVRIQIRLAALDIDLPVGSGQQPRLVVTLQGPDGPIVSANAPRRHQSVPDQQSRRRRSPAVILAWSPVRLVHVPDSGRLPSRAVTVVMVAFS